MGAFFYFSVVSNVPISWYKAICALTSLNWAEDFTFSAANQATMCPGFRVITSMKI